MRTSKTITLVATMAAFLGCATGQDDGVFDDAPVSERAAPDFEEVYGNFHVLGYEADNGAIRVVFADAESGDDIVVADYDQRSDTVPRIQADDVEQVTAISEFLQSLEQDPVVAIGIEDIASVVMWAIEESTDLGSAASGESFRYKSYCGCYSHKQYWSFWGSACISPSYYLPC